MFSADRLFMIELWVSRMLADTEFEAGYYTGMFESHAAQNAISPDEFPALQQEARKRLGRIEIAVNGTPIEIDEVLLRQSVGIEVVQ